jgi:hypothetical protein
MSRKLAAVAVLGLATLALAVLASTERLHASTAPVATTARPAPSSRPSSEPATTAPMVELSSTQPSPSTAEPVASGQAKAPGHDEPRATDADASDVDRLASELALREDQREHVRTVLLEAEDELDEAMRGCVRGAHEPDFEAMEGASRAVLARARTRVRALLDPEQRRVFDEHEPQ